MRSTLTSSRASLLLAVALAVVASGVASGATSSTVVGATVPSATSVDAAGCPSGTAGVTQFGVLLPGASSVTTADCVVTWGSSNDSAQLRLAQEDASDVAMRRAGSDGSLDATFGASGSTVVPVSAGRDEAWAMDVTADGKIAAAGPAQGGSDLDVGVVRLLANGTPDPAFSGDGRTSFPIGTANDITRGLIIQPDDKVLLAGSAVIGGASQFFVARLLPDGSLDPTFSGDGIQTLDPGPNADYAKDIALLPDGRIVVVGTSILATGGVWDEVSVARLLANGTADTSFGPGGIRRFDFLAKGDDGTSLTALPDGSLLVLADSTDATSQTDFVVARIASDGVLDTSFGAGGWRQIPLGGTYDWSYAIVADRRGPIYIAGSVDTGTAGDMVVARLTASGVIDGTFSGDGIVTVSVGSDYAEALDIALLADGRPFVAGYATGPTNIDMAFARFELDGDLDPTLDGDGTALRSLGSGDATVSAIRLLADGRVVAAGDFNPGPATDMAFMRLTGDLRVADYAAGIADWSAGQNAFGACLRALTGTGVTAVWNVDATCSAANGAHWRGVPASSALAAARVGTTSGAATDGVARLRFGLRTATSQPPGTYQAPLAFEVIAPAA